MPAIGRLLRSGRISCPGVLPLQRLRYAERSCHSGWDILFLMASPQAELSQSSLNQRLVLAGQVAFFPTGILSTLLGPMLPILIARWTLNDTQAGNLFLVQFLAMMVGVQLSGVMLARGDSAWRFCLRSC